MNQPQTNPNSDFISYILESLRKHHLHNSRQDTHSNRVIKSQQDRYPNGINTFSPYVLQSRHFNRHDKEDEGRKFNSHGRSSPELAIDKEIVDYEGLRLRSDKGKERASTMADFMPDGRLDQDGASDSRLGKSSTATIKPGDTLGTPFSTLDLNVTPRTSAESFRDPNVRLNYSKTIGKTRKGLGRFMGLRVDDNQPIPSLAGSSVNNRESRIGSSSSATPTAHQTGIHGRLASGLFRRSTASTMESFSNSPRLPPTAFSPPVRSQGQSNDRTPTGRTLSGFPAPSNTLRQPALSRIQRPRADSAPMVVISSPGNTRVESDQIEETPRNTKTGHGERRSNTARTRNASGEDKARQRGSLAFSPSAVQAILGDEDESAVASDDENNIPRPGEDPREHAKRDQYGSILAQTMMSQASRRRPGLAGRKVSLYAPNQSTTVAEESEGSDTGGMDTDDYDTGDVSTDVPESQQSNQRLSNFEMGLTKADESLLGGLDLGERMSVNTTSSYITKKSKVQSPRANSQLAFEKRPIQAAGPNQAAINTANSRPGALTLLFHPPEVSNEGSTAPSAAVSIPFSVYASVPPPHNSTLPSLTFKMYFPFSQEPLKPIEITVRKDVTVEEVIGWALFKYCESGRKPEVHAGHESGPNKEVNPAIWRTTAGWALRIVEDDGEVDEDFPGKKAICAGSSIADVFSSPSQQLWIEIVALQSLRSTVSQSSKLTRPKVSVRDHEWSYDRALTLKLSVQQNAAKLPPQALAVPVPESTAPSRPSVSRSSSRVSSVNGRSATQFPASVMSDMPANPADAFGTAATNGPSGMGGVMVPLKIRVIRTKDVQHIDFITV